MMFEIISIFSVSLLTAVSFVITVAKSSYKNSFKTFILAFVYNHGVERREECIWTTFRGNHHLPRLHNVFAVDGTISYALLAVFDAKILWQIVLHYGKCIIMEISDLKLTFDKKSCEKRDRERAEREISNQWFLADSAEWCWHENSAGLGNCLTFKTLT